MATAPATFESPTASSTTAPRIGWVLSGIVIAFLVMDSTMKLLALPVVTQASAALGWPDDAGTARLLGALWMLPLPFALFFAAPLAPHLLPEDLVADLPVTDDLVAAALAADSQSTG